MSVVDTLDIEDLEEGETPLLVLSNNVTDLKVATLEFLYKSLSYGQLAYMDGKDPETDEIVPLLVGLEPTPEGKVRIYPLAILQMHGAKVINYLVPDGIGNYSDIKPGEPVDLFRIPGNGEEAGSGETQGLDKTKLN